MQYSNGLPLFQAYTLTINFDLTFFSPREG